GGQVYDQIKFGWLLDWNVARFCAAENLIDIIGGAPEQIWVVGSVGYQTSRFDVVPRTMHRWQSRARRQDVDANPVGVGESIRTNIQCFCSASKCLEGRNDILRSANFELVRFETE